ncbi:hypothetical protein C4565_07975 [Candidatus Parcubacteria bacterium]|nr:MAG: hypothetical protein C4565_07975 [Candidatus Parcubacteria bacterium]
MKYLVDVNYSKSNKFLKEHPDYQNVKYAMDEKVEDQEIMKYAKRGDYVLYTQDEKFALYALIAGLKVWFRNQQTGEEYKLVANHAIFE